jgi:hypothetical protein
MTQTIDAFKELAHGLVRPNRFKSKIFFPEFLGGELPTAYSEVYIESTSIPSIDLGEIEVPLYGGSVLKIAGDEVYAPWSCTIKADGGLVVYKAIRRWMEFIKSPIVGTRAKDLSYLKNIELRLLDGANQTILTSELTSAFPTSLGEFTLSYEERDTISRFDCTFAYSIPVTDMI